MERAAAAYLARPAQAAESIFDYLHDELPRDLAPQRAEVAASGDRSPDR